MMVSGFQSSIISPSSPRSVLMLDPTTPAWLTNPDVERAIRLLPGFHHASLVEWSGGPLAGGAGVGLGVWRLEGTAIVESVPCPWSIVLKGWAGQETDDPPTSWDWPYREMELYRSGMLEKLADGIRAPRYFGDVVRDDGSVWVWLEDITDGIQPPWPTERYGVIARQLGQYNGSFLSDRPLPDASYLSRNWMRDWVELSGRALEVFLADADLARKAIIYTPEVLDGFARLWSHRHALYDEMAHLPQTFCHLDAFSRNIFVRETPGEPDDTILIDWSYAGIGTLGEDLVPLVGASVAFLDAPVSDLTRLSEVALGAYIDGLKDAGWRGDAAAVRRVFYAAMGLRYGIGPMRFMLFAITDPAGDQFLEQMIGRPNEDIFPNSLALNTWLVRTAIPHAHLSHLASRSAA
jgi:hypothetical protein